MDKVLDSYHIMGFYTVIKEFENIRPIFFNTGVLNLTTLLCAVLTLVLYYENI